MKSNTRRNTALIPTQPTRSSGAGGSNVSSPPLPALATTASASAVSNGGGKKVTVTREEFVISMMLLLGRVDMVHVREAQRVFGALLYIRYMYICVYIYAGVWCVFSGHESDSVY